MKHAHKVSVFLVDDDTHYLKSLEHYLLHILNLNIRIRSFSKGDDCIKELNEETGIVLLNHDLKGEKAVSMNGIEVTRKIKELFPEIKVIFLSGRESLDIAIETIKYGIYDYIVKNDGAFSKIKHLLRHSLREKNKRSYKPVL